MTLPKTMRAAILTEIQKPLIIDEVHLPELLDFGQVLVKLHYTGICGSQLGEIAGAKGQDNYLPHLLGHEGSGVVEQVVRSAVERGGSHDMAACLCQVQDGEGLCCHS